MKKEVPCRDFFFAMWLFKQGILGAVQLGVDSAGLQQLLVSAAFGDNTVGNGHNALG